MLVVKKTTKDYISESLYELMKIKPYHKITVKDISFEAGISTVTFYKLFRNKEEVYYYQIYTFGKKMLFKSAEECRWVNFVYDSIVMNIRYINIATNIVRNCENEFEIVDIFHRANVALAIEFIKEKRGKTNLEETLIFQLELYFYGCIYVLINEMNKGFKMTPEKLTELILRSMPVDLQQYLLD